MSDAGAPAASPLLVGRGLGRSYRGRSWALEGVDLELSPGESIALLGPNGAGKTTLLSILAGLASDHEGELRWNGRGGRIGWAPQRPAVYGRLTVRENLELFAALERRDDPPAVAAELIARADLGAFADHRARALSTGTLQRLNLSVALAGAPQGLLLDEPTATLSPDQRIRLWEWLHALRDDEGLALLFSTQSVDEAARHASRLLILSSGRVAFSGTIGELSGGGGVEAAEQAFLRLMEPGT